MKDGDTVKVWLLQPSEILPLKKDARLLRMGLLAEELSRNKENEITWFTSSFDHFHKKQLFDKDTLYKIKDNYHLKILYAKGYKRNISIARIINHRIIGWKLKKQMKLMEKPDIIFVSFPTIEFAEEAIKYGKKNHIPVVVDVRDLWPDNFKQNLCGIIKIMAIPYIWFLNIKTKKIFKNADYITSISDLMLDWGLKKGNRIKNKLDKSFYIGYKQDIQKEKVIKKYQYLFKDSFNICFFATINNQFNYNLLIEIAETLKEDNINIIICGNGPQYDNLYKKCQNINNIKLLGWCDKDELRYILMNSKIGLAPYKDTFDFRMSVSNKFCEYSSLGLPIIITCHGYMSTIIEKNNIGISSDNPHEIRDYIIKLKNNEKLYKETRKKFKNVYEKLFNADNIYPNMVKYLEDVRKEYK